MTAVGQSTSNPVTTASHTAVMTVTTACGISGSAGSTGSGPWWIPAQLVSGVSEVPV